MTNRPVRKHFDSIARFYDRYKKRNKIYYDTLIQAVRKFILKKDCPILDIGCGTGTILYSLKPTVGIGIDNSSEMIKLAKQKYGQVDSLKFKLHDIEKKQFPGKFGYILLIDVLEHLANKDRAINNIRKMMDKNTTLIISMANPLWEPFLLLMEKLHLKMPEGPHYRLSEKEFLASIRKYGLQIINKQVYFPKINIPFLEKLALIYIYEMKKVD